MRVGCRSSPDSPGFPVADWADLHISPLLGQSLPEPSQRAVYRSHGCEPVDWVGGNLRAPAGGRHMLPWPSVQGGRGCRPRQMALVTDKQPSHSVRTAAGQRPCDICRPLRGLRPGCCQTTGSHPWLRYAASCRGSEAPLPSPGSLPQTRLERVAVGHMKRSWAPVNPWLASCRDRRPAGQTTNGGCGRCGSQAGRQAGVWDRRLPGSSCHRPSRRAARQPCGS